MSTNNRRSIRLKGYDYAQAGLYFITICTQDRIHLFGQIIQQQMVLNTAGQIAADCWQAIPEHFPQTTLHEWVVMPNHIHGIIEITAGANQHSPDIGVKNISPGIGANQRSPDIGVNIDSPQRVTPFRSPSQTIGSIVRGFKIGVTKWFHSPENDFTPNIRVWQRDYYDHIIRSNAAYQRIAQYIISNPANWKEDRFSH
ncbi:transposase [Niabella hirudinis]|uniref:transposase n=1 Tax=Niabella hirudinis TaxID=1285929 RepID=UPI003EC04EA8